VRTALEDFVAESKLEWRTLYIPGFHGLGIAFTRDRIDSNESLRQTIDSIWSADFFEKWAEELELARIDTHIAQSKMHERQVRPLSREVENLRMSLSQAEREFERSLTTLSAELDLVNTRYERVVNSKSWRLTHPLRRGAQFIRSGV
jgi:hypothetical protein